jgi:hypothetical protein
MSEIAFKNTLSEIVATIASNNKIIKDLQEDNKKILEIVSNIHERIDDIGTKIDFVLNMGHKKPKETNVKPTKSKPDKITDSKEPVTETETSAPKIIKNIMTYFKTKYIADNACFDDILEENQAPALFAENEKDLSSKKGDAKIKSQSILLFRNLNPHQKKKVRERMNDEIDALSINNDDDIKEEAV